MSNDIIEQRVESKKSVWFEIRVRHKAASVEVWLRAHPSIEEFFEGLSNGGTDSLESYGRFWSSPKPETPQRVYKMGREVDGGYNYALNNPSGMLESDRDGNPAPNISFLRLVGIGTPEGVKFLINTPIHIAGLRALESKLANAVRLFANDYIVPVSIHLKLVGNEERP